VIEIRRYVTASGKDVFGEWLANLKDARAQAKVAIRIDRVAAGNFSDCKPLRGGIWELRIDWGQATATNESSRQISNVRSRISKTIERGQQQDEDQSEHFP